ncbi:MAG: MFS transporter, partial [Tumebacillaceae bacterium]
GTITPDTSRAMLTFYMVVVGFAVGFSFSVLGISAIHGFDANQRGSASSTMSFVRSLGMTVGISVYGIIQRDDFTQKLADTFAGMGQAPQGASFSDPRALLSPEGRALIPGPILEKITSSLSSSISHTFAWTLLPAVLALLFVFVMSNERMVLPPQQVKMKAKKNESTL